MYEKIFKQMNKLQHNHESLKLAKKKKYLKYLHCLFLKTADRVSMWSKFFFCLFCALNHIRQYNIR